MSSPFYVALGLTIAVASGLIIGQLRLECWGEDFVWEMQSSGAQDGSGKLTWEKQFAQARDAVRQIVGKVWPCVVVGIAIGATIRGYVPTDALAITLTGYLFNLVI